MAVLGLAQGWMQAAPKLGPPRLPPGQEINFSTLAPILLISPQRTHQICICPGGAMLNTLACSTLRPY